jgi:hypothetical protein
MSVVPTVPEGRDCLDVRAVKADGNGMSSVRSATGRSVTAPVAGRAVLRRFVPFAAVIAVVAVFFHRIDADRPGSDVDV